MGCPALQRQPPSSLACGGGPGATRRGQKPTSAWGEASQVAKPRSTSAQLQREALASSGRVSEAGAVSQAQGALDRSTLIHCRTPLAWDPLFSSPLALPTPTGSARRRQPDRRRRWRCRGQGTADWRGRSVGEGWWRRVQKAAGGLPGSAQGKASAVQTAGATREQPCRAPLTCASCRTRTGAREPKLWGSGGSAPFHTTSTSAAAWRRGRGGAGGVGDEGTISQEERRQAPSHPSSLARARLMGRTPAFEPPVAAWRAAPHTTSQRQYSWQAAAAACPGCRGLPPPPLLYPAAAGPALWGLLEARQARPLLAPLPPQGRAGRLARR